MLSLFLHQTLLMMLYVGRDGQTTCTAGKVKTLPSFNFNSCLKTMHSHEGTLNERNFILCALKHNSCMRKEFEANRHQIMLEHLLHAFDLLKSSQKIMVLTLWVCPSKPLCSTALIMTGTISFGGRMLSFCCNTACNGNIQMTAWEHEDLNSWK